MAITPPLSRAPSSDAMLTDFANLIAAMNRFITSVSGLPLFATAGVGLSEWALLSVLSQNEGISSGQLAKMLGVSRQRVNQITSVLESTKLISVSVAQQDARRNELRLTAEGKNQLGLVNCQLQPMVAAAFEGREEGLSRLVKQYRRLLRTFASSSPSKAVKWTGEAGPL